MKDSLILSSDLIFHTIEGEGPSAGIPAVFMRLSMCNLTCKGWATPENPNGCDSASAWQIKNEFSFERLFGLYEQLGFQKFLLRGDVWKITGGEPLIQQKMLLEFVRGAVQRWELDWAETRVEFETNATIMPDQKWSGTGYMDPVFVCSPKLANNGDPREKRYNPAVLEWHGKSSHCGTSFFKFVVTRPEDVEEIKNDFIEPFTINPQAVFLMPEGATNPVLQERSAWVAETCKKEGFRFSPRLQVYIWNQTLGV